jgi:hypothetical protein
MWTKSFWKVPMVEMSEVDTCRTDPSYSSDFVGPRREPAKHPPGPRQRAPKWEPSAPNTHKIDFDSVEDPLDRRRFFRDVDISAFSICWKGGRAERR